MCEAVVVPTSKPEGRDHGAQLGSVVRWCAFPAKGAFLLEWGTHVDRSTGLSAMDEDPARSTTTRDTKSRPREEGNRLTVIFP